MAAFQPDRDCSARARAGHGSCLTRGRASGPWTSAALLFDNRIAPYNSKGRHEGRPLLSTRTTRSLALWLPAAGR